MERVQELEWAEAQKIAISEDLVAAAKQQLQFLAEVDRHRQLYDGSALNRAIHRYKYCWLPLLAKQAKSQVSEGPLVVPLDCEWIWHCHKLNPVRYKNDCKELYGRILGSQNVVSSTQASCKKQTEEIWSRMYPCEPYELNLSTQISEDSGNNVLGAQKSTNYDLVSAVKRQSSFYYQVSRSHMSDDVYLEGAVARYKGFLHLIKRNQEKSISQFCVPTYDIDLIWHSHQLRPVSYCKDLVAILGRVLEHDDTDSDRTKGNKLDTGCLQTTKQWEETFGSRYWRAGAMYRGSVPSPLTINVSDLDNLSKVVGSNKYQSMLQIPRKMFSEVMLEIVDVINLPVGCEENLFATFSMKQPDMFFKGNRSISIFPKAKERQVAIFQSEPKGELVCQLMTNSSSVRYLARPGRVLGTASISLQDLMKPDSSLSYERWIELIPNSGTLSSQPINLRIALSFTPPVQAPFMLHLVKAHRQGKGWTCIVDDAGNEIMSLQMRDSIKVEAKYGYLFKKEAVGMTTSGETPILAEFLGAGWSLLNSTWRFQLQNKLNNVGQIFELTGRQKVVILPGRKLEYENGSCEKHKSAENLMTAVEFSAKHPYGRAVALFNLKSGFVQINEEWLVFPGILLAFLLANTLRKEVDFNLSANRESPRELDDALKQAMISKMKSDFDWETTGCENCDAVHAIGGTEYNTSNAECKVGDIMKSTTCGGCGGRCGGGSCGGGCGGGGCGGGSCRGGCGGGGCNSGHETK